MSAEIVKHPVNCFDCGFGRFGLLGSDFVEGYFDAWVDFRIIGVGAGDGLDSFGAFGVKRRRGSRYGRFLSCFAAIDGGSPRVGCMLRFGWWFVTKFF